MNKLMMIGLLLALHGAPASAASSCDQQAADKKLAGAAKASFLKKCEAGDKPAAQASCEATAADKKLAGAAKASFVKKCVADAKSGKAVEKKAEAKAAKADAKGDKK